MANKFWIGTAGPDATDAANWSTSSGGSGGSAPGTGDTAIFDGESVVKTVASVKTATNALEISSHGLSASQPVWIESDIKLPGPNFGERTTYYVIVGDSNNISLALSASDAAAGTAIAITSIGDGTIKVRGVYFCLLPDGWDVTSMEVHSKYAGIIQLINAITIRKGMYLNGTIQSGDGTITFTTTPPSATTALTDFASGGHIGAAVSYGTRMVLNGQYAQINAPEALNYTYAQTQTPVTFDDGPYPKVGLNGAVGTAVVFSPEYFTPTATEFNYYDDGKASMYSLTIVGRAASPCQFKPNAVTTNEYTDGSKKFKITSDNGFICTIGTFNGGFSEWDFQGSSGGFILPMTGGSSTGTYGVLSDDVFKSQIRKLKLHVSTAGHKFILTEGDRLDCETLEIGDGCVLQGPLITGTYGAEIHCVKPPKIEGSWNFGQVTPGVYRSPVTLPIRHDYGGFSSLPNFSVRYPASGSQEIVHNVLTLITSWEILHQHGLTFDDTNDKFVAPSTGAYHIDASIAFEAASAGSAMQVAADENYKIQIHLLVNGGSVYQETMTYQDTYIDKTASLSTILHLNKDQYLQIGALCVNLDDTGGTKHAKVNNDSATRCRWSVMRLS